MLVEMSRSEVLKDIAVIVVSGMDQEGHVLRAVQSGALDYLTKPVNSRSMVFSFDSDRRRSPISSSIFFL